MKNTTDCNNNSLNLLKKYSISLLQVAKASNCDRKTVAKVINATGSTHKSTDLLVQTKTVELLRVMGWQGNPDDLWVEYDQPEQEAA